MVEAGDRVGKLEVLLAGRPLQSVTYFRVPDGKQLEVGDAIRVAPDTVERARYGSINGEVREVSTFAVTPEEIENEIGSPVVASELVQAGYLVQVVADLAPNPNTVSKLDWTSSKGPPGEVSAGTTASARVAIRKQRPITFVLPILKETVGLD